MFKVEFVSPNENAGLFPDKEVMQECIDSDEYSCGDILSTAIMEALMGDTYLRIGDSPKYVELVPTGKTQEQGAQELLEAFKRIMVAVSTGMEECSEKYKSFFRAMVIDFKTKGIQLPRMGLVMSPEEACKLLEDSEEEDEDKMFNVYVNRATRQLFPGENNYCVVIKLKEQLSIDKISLIEQGIKDGGSMTIAEQQRRTLGHVEHDDIDVVLGMPCDHLILLQVLLRDAYDDIAVKFYGRTGEAYITGVDVRLNYMIVSYYSVDGYNAEDFFEGLLTYCNNVLRYQLIASLPSEEDDVGENEELFSSHSLIDTRNINQVTNSPAESTTSDEVDFSELYGGYADALFNNSADSSKSRAYVLMHLLNIPTTVSAKDIVKEVEGRATCLLRNASFDRQQSNLDKLRQVLGLLMDWMYLEYYVEDTDDLLSYDKVVFEDLWRLKIEEIW